MDEDGSRPYWEKEPGVAAIKSEFVLWDKLKPGRAGRGHRDQDDDDAAEGNTKSIPRDDGPPPKKPRSEGEPANDEQGADGGGPSKRQQKKRGANKARQFARTSDEVKLCASAAAGQECTRSKPTEAAPPANEGETGKGKGRRRRGWDEGCRFSHDVEAYLASKPADILSHLDTNFAALPSTDFTFPTPTADVDDPDKPIPVPRPTTVPRCPLLVATGQCPFGYRCRFLSAHQDPSSALSTDPDRREAYLSSLTTTDPRNGRRLEWTDRGEINSLGLQPLRSLRKRKYPLAGAKEYMDSIGQPMDQREGHKQGKRWRNGEQKEAEEEEDQDEAGEGEVDAKEEPTANGEAGPTANGDAAVNGESHAHAKSLDVDLARARPSERPRLQHWRATGQNLYLAPLTTVGNLPFRRLASSLGADITCGEMALGQDLMAGSGSEWSLVRRYKGEGCFGAQIAGSRPQVLVPTAEILSKECYLDFVDVNCGCPIDLVFQKGAGSALLDHPSKLGRSVVGMNRVLGPQGVPVTIKLRTGILESKPTAHKIFARAQGEWGVSAITLHGRSRQQRYSKRADWTYISQCVDLSRTVAENLGEDPIPIFGNGDCFDYREYWESVEKSKADGVMLARGALIKPWLFTEIKERRDWDISARERLDLYRQLASYGLEHWGSDTIGVNQTRRFLCEAISFQYRYIPVGLLERLPARINERPLPFKGRDELETLLASGDSEDWVRISNLFLGKPPDNWSFTPKHRSNASGQAAEENG